MTDAPGADERRVRQWLRRRGVGPDAPPQHGSALLTAPQPEAPRTAPAPAAPVIGAPRLPDWRRPKPELVPVDPEPTDPSADPDPAADPDPDPAADPDPDPDPDPEPDSDPDPEPDPDPDPEPDPDPDPEPDPDPADRLPDKRATGPARAPARQTKEIRAAADQIAAGLLTDPVQRRRIAHVAYNAGAAAIGHTIGLAPWMHTSLDYYGRHDTNNGAIVGVGVIVVCLIAEIKSHAWRGSGAPIALRFLGWIARVPLASAVLALALYGPDASL